MAIRSSTWPNVQVQDMRCRFSMWSVGFGGLVSDIQRNVWDTQVGFRTSIHNLKGWEGALYLQRSYYVQLPTGLQLCRGRCWFWPAKVLFQYFRHGADGLRSVFIDGGFSRKSIFRRRWSIFEWILGKMFSLWAFPIPRVASLLRGQFCWRLRRMSSYRSERGTWSRV